MNISNEHGKFNTEDVKNCQNIDILQNWLLEAQKSVLFGKYKAAEALKEKSKLLKEINEVEEKYARCQMASVLQEMLVQQIEEQIQSVNEPLPSTVIERVLGEE